MSNYMKRGPAFERVEPVRKRRRFNYMTPDHDPKVQPNSELAKISINKTLTSDERRIDLAKQYLAAVEHNFGTQYEKNINEEKEDIKIDDLKKNNKLHEAINKKLLEKMYQKEGKFFYKYGSKLKDYLTKNPKDKIKIKSIRGHRLSVTCMALDITNKYVVTGSKDGSIIKWDLMTGKKILKCWHAWPIHKYKNRSIKLETKKKLRPKPVLCVAISPDNKYLVTGGEDCLIRVWLFDKFRFKSTFRGHRSHVTGLSFSTEKLKQEDSDVIDETDIGEIKESITLFSCSKDRQIRVYDINELGFSEPLFGHTLSINNIDSIIDNKCLTVSDDRTIRYWKLNTQSQLVFKGGHLGFIDTCCLLNNNKFISGSNDGSIALWHTNKKYPIFKKEECHLSNNSENIHWITSLGCKLNSDMFISGSSNGIIKLWLLKSNKFFHITSIKIPKGGYINDIKLNKNGNIIILAIGNEPRLGRWNTIKSVKNGICIIKLPIDCTGKIINYEKINNKNKIIKNKKKNDKKEINEFLEDSGSDNEEEKEKENIEIEYDNAEYWDRWSSKEKGYETNKIKEDTKKIKNKKNEKIDENWQDFFNKVYE